jgi:hypothetical protein
MAHWMVAVVTGVAVVMTVDVCVVVMVNVADIEDGVTCGFC